MGRRTCGMFGGFGIPVRGFEENQGEQRSQATV